MNFINAIDLKSLIMRLNIIYLFKKIENFINIGF